MTHPVETRSNVAGTWKRRGRSDISGSGGGGGNPWDLPGWTLTFQDEFDGTINTSPSTTLWNIRNNQGNSNEMGWITNRTKNVFLGGDSCLHIKTYNEQGLSGQPTGHPYTTGYLDTIGKFSQKYGRWEMYAKLPVAHNASAGLWPAFWLRPDSGPADGELDIMEAWGTPTDNSEGFDPWKRYSGTVWQNESGGSSPHGWSPTTNDLSTGFHKYATEWDATSIRFYYDDGLFYTATVAANSWITASFNANFNIRLNLQISNSFWGDAAPPTDTVFPAEFVVDYVRAWQKTP